MLAKSGWWSVVAATVVFIHGLIAGPVRAGVPQGTLYQAGEVLSAGSKEQPAAKPSDLSKGVLAQLDKVPSLHSKTYARGVSDQGVRASLLADTQGAEHLLAGIASLQGRLMEVPPDELVSSLGLLLELRDRITRSRGYGNFICAMGISFFVETVGMERLLAAPELAKPLGAVFLRNQAGWEAGWSILRGSVQEETRGVWHLEVSAESPFEARLLEILRQPGQSDPKLDLEMAKHYGAFAVASDVLDKRKVPGGATTVTRLLDTVDRAYLVALVCLVQNNSSAAVWWSSFLERRLVVPRNYGEFLSAFKADSAERTVPVNPMTAKPFQADELFAYVMQRETLAREGAAFLLPTEQGKPPAKSDSPLGPGQGAPAPGAR